MALGKITFEVPSENILLQLDDVTAASPPNADELAAGLGRLSASGAENFQRKADRQAEPVSSGDPDPDDVDYLSEEAAFEYVYFDRRCGLAGDILLFKFIIPGNRHLAYFAVQADRAKILAFCDNDNSEKVSKFLRLDLRNRDRLA